MRKFAKIRIVPVGTDAGDRHDVQIITDIGTLVFADKSRGVPLVTAKRTAKALERRTGIEVA